MSIHKNTKKHLKENTNQNVDEILTRLNKTITPKIELNHEQDGYKLLIAAVLSSQSTDISVNKILPNLFKNNLPNQIIKINDRYSINTKYVSHISSLSQKDIENKIKTIGIYRMKAKYIYEITKIIIKEYQYTIPSTRTNLEKLPGVGRKVASLILNEIFNQNTIPVDTHVFRVSNRLGIVNTTNIIKTEKLLETIIPENLIKNAHYSFVLHGRYVCTAKNPKCDKCVLNDICPKINVKVK